MYPRNKGLGTKLKMTDIKEVSNLIDQAIRLLTNLEKETDNGDALEFFSACKKDLEGIVNEYDLNK